MYLSSYYSSCLLVTWVSHRKSSLGFEGKGDVNSCVMIK